MIFFLTFKTITKTEEVYHDIQATEQWQNCPPVHDQSKSFISRDGLK